MLSSIYHDNQPVTIGILGGGQLAKMSAQAAYRLGLRVAVIEPAENSPAGMMTKADFPLGWYDSTELERFVEVSDIITLENEFIAPEILDGMTDKRLVFPTPDTLRQVQDKFIQKQTMQRAGIPVPVFAAINSVEEAYTFGKEHGYPYVMKTRTLGYDGYGNATVGRDNQAMVAFMRFTSDPDVPRQMMAEKFVKFRKELAVMVARNRRGETAVYPCVETVQENHICRYVLAPAPDIDDGIRKKAQEIAVAAVEAVEGVGVFGVEMFLTDTDKLLYNEIAPRPHNSGHYTIEGCYTSQFENHIRAICNLPLGSPDLIVPAAVMANVLGKRIGSGVPDTVVGLMRHGRVSFHLYGKATSRVGRKMGHLTALGASVQEALALVKAAEEDLLW
ncbi:MAG: 5-(carboxyamino)imidazole ribonucleotide synthase [Candidatus Kapabacteria bacterium]|nr:5-(carboxyamino)imidazole ribonucleotide synthase [Candidatus Kapabacteria bacterium]